MFLPDIILASRTWSTILVMISLIPLQNPSHWSIFLKSITEVHTFSLILWLGRPEVLRKLRKSGVRISTDWYSSLISDLSIESKLMYSFSSLSLEHKKNCKQYCRHKLNKKVLLNCFFTKVTFNQWEYILINFFNYFYCRSHNCS